MTNNPPKVWGYSWGSNQTGLQRTRSPDQILRRAIAAYQRGDFVNTRNLCLQISASAAQFADALNLRAAAASALGDRAEAAILLAQLVALIPAHPVIQANFGALLGPSSPMALAPLQRAVQLDPNDAAAHVNFAIALAMGTNRQAAIKTFAVAAILAPGLAEVWFNLGSHQKIDLCFARALNHLRRAIWLKPTHFEARSLLAPCLSALGDHKAAIEILQKLIADYPLSALTFSNLGDIYQAAQKYDQALWAYDQAIQLDPNHGRTRYNRACLLLALGDFANGFREYEWRWHANGGIRNEHMHPLWGGETLFNRSIFLHAEQGFGDVIQFLRFAPVVKNLGARVILGIHAPLAPLIRNSFPDLEVIETGEMVPAVDYQCPLMSLPYALRLSFDDIPGAVPYLHPPKDRVGHWADHLTKSKKLRVGLAWSGNPEHENDRNRSMRLETLSILLNVPDAEFYILQKALSESDQAVIGAHPNLHIGSFDFAETAALMCNLDLVISVDTSIAHLAGALGLSVWVLLAIPCDWRWQYQRTDSPWYPTMRLFRQSDPGDWAPVLNTVRDEMIKLVDAKRPDGQ